MTRASTARTTYDEQHRLASWITPDGVVITSTYDANGSLTGSSLGMQLDYNDADQTTAIRPRADQGLRAEFTYRGAGQTERATSSPAGGVTAEPVCVPLGGCTDEVEVEATTGQFTHTVLGISSETVVTDTAVTTTGFTRDPSGRVLAAHGPTGSWWYLTDALGTVVGITGEDGTTLASYAYDPFGQTTTATGPVAQLNRWRFAGAWLDSTGLYKIGQRYYHPVWGRWTQPDPLNLPLDPVNWNRYVYAGNNPVNYTDPTGLFSAGCFMTNFIGFGWEPAERGPGGIIGGSSWAQPTFNGRVALSTAATEFWKFTASKVVPQVAPRVARFIPYVGWLITADQANKAYQTCR